MSSGSLSPSPLSSQSQPPPSPQTPSPPPPPKPSLSLSCTPPVLRRPIAAEEAAAAGADAAGRCAPTVIWPPGAHGVDGEVGPLNSNPTMAIGSIGPTMGSETASPPRPPLVAPAVTAALSPSSLALHAVSYGDEAGSVNAAPPTAPPATAQFIPSSISSHTMSPLGGGSASSSPQTPEPPEAINEMRTFQSQDRYPPHSNELGLHSPLLPPNAPSAATTAAALSLLALATTTTQAPTWTTDLSRSATAEHTQADTVLADSAFKSLTASEDLHTCPPHRAALDMPSISAPTASTAPTPSQISSVSGPGGSIMQQVLDAFRVWGGTPGASTKDASNQIEASDYSTDGLSKAGIIGCGSTGGLSFTDDGDTTMDESGGSGEECEGSCDVSASRLKGKAWDVSDTARNRDCIAANLPDEILDCIFQQVLECITLYRCALVCRSWSRVARPVLWEGVTLFSSADAARFIRSSIYSLATINPAWASFAPEVVALGPLPPVPEEEVETFPGLGHVRTRLANLTDIVAAAAGGGATPTGLPPHVIVRGTARDVDLPNAEGLANGMPHTLPQTGEAAATAAAASFPHMTNRQLIDFFSTFATAANWVPIGEGTAGVGAALAEAMGLPPAAEEDDDEDEDDDEEETERTFAGSNTADPMLQVTDQPIALATSAAGGAENREEMDMHDDISSAQMPIDTASTSLEVTASGSSSSQRPVLPVGAPGSPSTVPLFAAAATALQSGSTHALLQHLPQPEREHHVDHSESQLQDLRTPEILPPIQPANEANAPTAAVTARAGGAPLVNGLDALLRPFNFGLIANGDDDMDLRDVPAIQFADLASQLVHMVRESPKLAELMGMAGPVKQVLKGQQQGQGSADGAGMLLESWKANSKELQMGLGAKVKKLTVPSFDCAVSWLPVLNMMLPNLQCLHFHHVHPDKLNNCHTPLLSHLIVSFLPLISKIESLSVEDAHSSSWPHLCAAIRHFGRNLRLLNLEAVGNQDAFDHPETLASVFPYLPNLEFLRLDGVTLGPNSSMEVLAATAGHRLTSVTIDYCVDVTMDSLSILWDRCPNLTFIGLAGIMMSPALPHVNNPQAQSSRSQTPALNNPLHLLKTLRLVDCDVTDALLARIAALSPALEFLRIVFEDDRCEGVLRTWEALSDATLMAFASKGTLETVALTWCPKMTAGALAAVLDGNPVSTLDLHKDPQTLVGRVSDDILRALIPRDADDMSFDSAPADSTSVNHLGKIARLHLYGQNALSDDTLRRILSAVSFASTVCVNNTKITEESVMSAINKRERSRHAIYAAEARRKGLPRPEGIPDDITDADIGDGGQPLEVLSLVGCVNIDDEAAARIAKAPGVQRVYYVPPTSAEDSITGTNPGDGGEAAGGDGAEIPVLQDGAEQAWAGADILDPSAVPNGDRLERMDEIAQGGAWYNDTTADEWASEEAQPPRSVEDILDVIMEGVEGEAADRVQHIRRDAATSPPPPLQMDVQEPASIPAVTSAPTPAPFHNLASSSSSSSSSSSHVSSSTLPSTSASSSSRSPRSGPSIAAVPSHSESFPTSQSDSTGAARAVADETQIPAEKATPVALPSNVIQEDRWFVDEGLDIMSLWETSVWKATGRWRFYI